MTKRVDAPDKALLPRLADIHKAAFEPNSRGWSADEIAALGERGGLYVSNAEDCFALFQLAEDEAELVTIATDPASQRNGRAAEVLMSAMKDLRVKGAARVFLEVAADNTPAKRLYLALGFNQIAERRDYYRRADGTKADALVFEARL
ncbi:MAG: GNAT family N-acetyltransferase [Pseudomonadota bacterium]